jgi:hypothetical protein
VQELLSVFTTEIFQANFKRRQEAGRSAELGKPGNPPASDVAAGTDRRDVLP